MTRLALALLFAAAIPMVACTTPTLVTQTKMAQGESYATGEAKFDSFFEEVLDARSKAADVDGEAPLRKSFAEGLGMPASAAADQMLSAAKEKADAMKGSGGALYVQLMPEAKLFMRDVKDKSGPLPKAVEDTVKLGVEKSDELTGLGNQIKLTEAKIDDLKHEADTAFPDAKKKAEVLLELEASQDVLEKARMKAFAESGRALAFVVAIMRAVDTGGADLVASADSGAKTKPTGKASGTGKQTGTGKPGSAGTGKPAGKKLKEDFDP